MRSLRQSNRNYFEAILQLRPDNKELLDFVIHQIDKNNIQIAKEIHKKYGTDLYISSNKFALQLARKLKKSFRGELTSTRTLYSRDRQSGKGVYRVTVCFRLEEKESQPEE